MTEPVFPLDDTTRLQVEAVLAVGLSWMLDTVQVAGALDQHHGVYSPVVAAARIYNFVPVGARRRPVIVYNVAYPVYAHGPLGELINPLAGDEECDWMISILADLGVKAAECWNGMGKTGSIGLAEPAHPSLIAAVDLYMAGCPECAPVRNVFCKAHNWFTAGQEKMTFPLWPA